MRIGHGYDVHRLVSGRLLVLGGVTIPHTTGLLGHSDADVLTHALIDALLGAAGLGDIGQLFPDDDPRYFGLNSLVLLEQVVALLATNNYKIINIDTTIVAQAPKLSPFLPTMKIQLSQSCQVCSTCVNIKATTEEHLGFTGTEQGISAFAVVLIA